MERKESLDTKATIATSPSEYIRNMSLKPENVLCKRWAKHCYFTANPRIVVFKKFEIGDVYNISLSIRNTSQVPRHLRLMSSENVSFNVTFKGSTFNTRLAPGMTHVYDVEFHPDERRNYFHDIVFKTDVEPFVVRVIAAGPRALLSFPDQIDMGETAVKVAKTKPILLQNIGEVFTGFSIFTDNPCFVVTPSKGSTEPGKAIQVNVTFTPTDNVKVSNGRVFLRYESGDTVQSIIYGEAVICNVRVREDRITIENTYLGLSRLVPIEIENNSNYVLRYEWVRYKSIAEDRVEKEKCKKVIEETIHLPLSNIITPSVQKLIHQRINSDQIELLENKNLAYHDDNYQIFPTSGEAWPRNRTNVSVTFQPRQVGTISTVAYLEIAGQENRIPVCLTGKCVGPALELNLLSLDIHDVYLCSTYSYEVLCKNVGPIPGTLMYLQKNANFGSTITVEPCEILVDLDGLKTMKLSFYSNRTGKFVERVDFVIKESSEVLSFVMKGTVVCPLIRTDGNEIDFHGASLCFTMKKQLSFFNLSHTSIEFDIRVLPDGYEMPITHEEFARAQTKPILSSYPREFAVTPSEGSVQPESCLQVQLTYTPNVVRSGEAQMQINMCKSSNAEPLLLPMTFQAKRAILNVTPDEIIIPFCFLNFPFCRDLTIANASDIDGYFYIVPQEVSSDTTILYSLSKYQGYLRSGKSKVITLTIMVKRVGLQNQSLRYKQLIINDLLSLGLETPVTCCEIICDGQGPVVFTKSPHLDWGEVQLLQTKSLTLELTNDSPIAAEFTTSLSKTKCIWDVEPSAGELDPNESISLTVSVKLRDTGKYSDRLSIAIFNGKTVSVNLSAVGVGTCIVFDPEIYPKFDMGFLFSHQDISIPIIIKNEGTRHHLVLLTNVEKVRQIKRSSTEETESTKFKIEPNMIELSPGSEEILNCMIRSNLNETISEKWFVYATVEAQGKRELQGTSEFTATFIEPNVIFNKSELTFILDLGWIDIMLQQTEELHLTNQSGRNLSTHLTIESPFVMINKCNCFADNIDMTLIDNESVCVKVHFPFDIENSGLLPQKYKGYLRIAYDEHQHIDEILCKAEVNLPHINLESHVLNLYCATGHSVESKIKLINDTPLPVYYRILLIKESFTYQKLPLIFEVNQFSEKGTAEDSSTCKTCASSASLSRDSSKDENELSSIRKTEDIAKRSSLSEGSGRSTKDYCENAEEYSERSLSDLESETIDPIDKFIQIVPEVGQIFPYSEQYVSFTFNGLESIKISGQAICEVARGSTETLYINAISDTVKCDVPQDEALDFGLQLFCTPSVTTLRLTNQCLIPLYYCIELSTNLLRVVEGPQMLDPITECFIKIERQPSAPGKFNEKLFLEIRHMEPFILDVQWFATIPQIYIQSPRNNAFTKYPVLFGYEAVRLIMTEAVIQDQITVELKCSSSDNNTEILDISEYEMMQLIDNNWEVVSCDEKYPSEIDIDMAFERLIVKDHIDNNNDVFATLNSEVNNGERPFLLAPAYLINMKFVLVEQIAHFSICLRNYGYEKAHVKLAKEKKKTKSSKTCFYVHLERNSELCQCESTFLNIVFSPKRTVFSRRRTDVSYKFYLEVKQGLTIPVKVQASAVYPCVIISVQTLSFDKVFIGECREMSFILKNDGFVECHWEIFIESATKNSTKPRENPFYVNYANDTFSPNKESIIKVYFKPYKNGTQKRNLIIVVSDAQETKKIRLIGCGVERNVKINKTVIKFPPIIPNARIVEENLIITNDNDYPIELYWQHMEDSLETNKIIRVLKHYYRTDEILIPQRRMGEDMPDVLVNFYKCLIYQMYLDDDFKEIIKNMLKDVTRDNYSENAIQMRSSKSETENSVKKGKSMPNLKKINGKQQIGDTRNNSSLVLSSLCIVDPNTIETLLHAYIDKLQRNSNFPETMKDPLSELYENYREASDCNERTVDLEKNLVIIFHGAPFTEYQETACRTARTLNLPLLNLNQLLLEGAICAKTQSARDFAKHLDNRYKEVTTRLTNLPTKKSSLNVLSRTKLPRRLPLPEELERMDVYSQYELKLEIIVQILGDLETSDSFTSSKFKEKMSVKHKETISKKRNVLPNACEDLFRDIFRERLSQSEFKYGYVLQTLNNDFIKNESTTLKILLEATGKVDIRWFITFHNSVELYELRIQNLNRAEADEEEKRVNELIQTFDNIDKMTQSRIDLLSEDDKALYNDFLHNKQQQTESQEPKRTSQSLEKTKKSKEESIISQRNENTSKSALLHTKEATVKKKETKFQDFEKISNAMKEYENSLDNLLETIGEWELKNSPESSKVVKRKDKSIAEIELIIKQSKDTFFIWHVRSEDPWDTEMYDATLFQIKTSFRAFAKDHRIEDKSIERVVQARTYSILKERDTAALLRKEIFTILPQNPHEGENYESECRRDNANDEESSGSTVKSLDFLDARCLLQPRESREYKIEFGPTEEGCYEGDFILTLVDNPETTFKISVAGLAEIPKLDLTPCSVFDRVQNAKVSESHKPAYYLNSQTYDFGSLLVMHAVNKFYKKSTQFYFKNISSVSATANFSLLCERYDYFDINPRQIEIKANETGIIDVTACALTIGCITDCLSLSINNGNNDKPEIIQLACNGIELSVELQPKDVNLGRVLMHKIENRIMTIRNKSAITIFWRFSAEAVGSQIKITPSEGKLNYKGCCEIELQYYADKINKADTKLLNFELSLDENNADPIATDTVTVTAETYEILYQLNSDVIDFKNVPVSSTKMESFVIKNSGPYEIEYKIQYQEIEILKKLYDLSTIATLKEDFVVQPIAGRILPKKSATINMTYTPSFEITLKSVPLLKCVIIEPHKSIGTVNENALHVSLISYFTRFSIEPFPILNFGTVALKATKSMKLNIENIGKFPLKYSILNQSRQLETDSNAKQNDKNISKSGKTPSKQAAKTGFLPKWNPFHLEKIMGELDPGQLHMITVRCCSDHLGHFNEKLTFIVSESQPVDEQDREVLLIANVCVPDIDFHNYNEIFIESHIVDLFDEFIPPSEAGEYTIFSRRTNCLYFCRVCIGSSYSICVALRNISFINGDVTIEILETSSITGAFNVNTNQINIPPMSKQSFTITFAPSSLGKFSASLKVRLDLPLNIEQRTLSIYLEGESCVPQVRLLKPSPKFNEKAVIDFGLSFIQEKREKVCTIQNVGQVADVLSIKMLDNAIDAYSIYIETDNERLACGCVVDKDVESVLTVRLIPGEIVNVKVHFLPIYTQNYVNHLEILMEKNPYEVIEVMLLGQGFARSVVFENLEIMNASLLDTIQKTCSQARSESSRKSILKPKVSVIFDPTPLMYKLDYEKCFLNQMNKISFKIINKTCNRHFRFELNPNPNIVCTPSAGHLAPCNFKVLTATFFASEPVTLSQMTIDCTVNEILLTKLDAESLWDTRQMNVSWEEKRIVVSASESCKEEEMLLKRVLSETREPEYEIVPSTTQLLQLCIYAIADYSEYECNIKTINFDNTLMFQTREYRFTLINTGNVNLNFSWNLIMDELYPIRLDQAKLKSLLSCDSRETVEEQKSESKILNDESPQQSTTLKWFIQTESSDLFSSAAGLTNRSTDTWMEGDNWPFNIRPENGSISPAESINCTLTFSPMDVFQYKAYLQCEMENLNPAREPLKIVINAISLLPYCHFEIEETDYLTSGRRDIKLPVPSGYNLADTDAINKIKIVEFKLMGVGECHTRYISLVNPTMEEYSYCWIRLSNEVLEKVPALQCLSETGLVESGNRTNISFCTVPEDVGIYESFWQFEIKKYNLKTLFLIVTNVVEPSISFRSTLIKLEDSAIGELKCSSFDIINNEDSPLTFHIKADSLYSEGRFQNITVRPVSGTLQPNAPQTFNIQYKPTLIGEHTFYIQCQIEKLRKAIKVAVVAQVVELSAKLIYIESGAQETELTTNYQNAIDIGQIILYEEQKVIFKIMNLSPIGFDYSWHLSNAQANSFNISMLESEGRIDKNSTNDCCLRIVAMEKLAIRNYPLALKIKYGPTYRLKLNVSAKKSPLEFNFTRYDFGPTYIQPQNGIIYSADLKITNHQKIFCSLKCTFKGSSSHIKLNPNQLSQSIPPNTTIRIPISFQPTEEKHYQGILHFSTLDSSLRQDVIIKGEGVNYRIHLKNPCDVIVDFGTILIGKSVSRKICVINEGCVPVKLKIDVIECSSDDTQDVSNRERKDSSRTLDRCPSGMEISSCTTNSFELAEFIEFSPNGLLNLKPNKEMEVTIKFKGVQRVKSLKIKMGLKTNSFTLPLTIVKGNCAMSSFYLNRTYISFGTIFEGCEANEKFALVNNGDLGSRFSWMKEKIKSHFNISPQSGYCSPGSEITFTCAFTPECLASCIRSQFNLELEGHENLSITVTGNCSPIPEPTESMEFSSQVHQSESREIKIYNDSDKTWYLKPMVFGEYFTTVSELSVKAKITQICVITYMPRKITTNDSFHKGKFVITLPDDKQPILYHLFGRCTPTIFSERVTRHVPAKKNHEESLIVYNNSDRCQTFVCTTEQVDPIGDKSFPVLQVDVPAKKQIYYEIPFFFEQEGHFIYKITFDDHQENYQCYDVEFIVTEPEIQAVIELSTCVRNSMIYTLKIENPLEHKDVTFNAYNINDEVIVHGLPATLAPLAFKNIKIEYLPLMPRDQRELLVISSEALGCTFYELHLIAKPPLPEKAINIKSSLGKSVDFNLRLKNYSRCPCDFDITVDEPSFTCPTTVSVRANEEVDVSVRFKPFLIGVMSATIKATSRTTGEFIFPVIGTITSPQPQGPFSVSPDEPALINFENVFLETKTFHFSVDNADFSINTISESIPSRQSFEITVRSRNNKKSPDKPRTGKLIVSCMNEDSNEIEWIYYLRAAVERTK